MSYNSQNTQIKLVYNTQLAVMQPTCSRALQLDFDTINNYPRIITAPFAIGPFGNRTGTPFTSQVGEITKSPPRRTHFKLWVNFFGSKLEGTAVQMQEIQLLPSTVSLTSKFSSKARLPKAWFTGLCYDPIFVLRVSRPGSLYVLSTFLKLPMGWYNFFPTCWIKSFILKHWLQEIRSEASPYVTTRW